MTERVILNRWVLNAWRHGDDDVSRAHLSVHRFDGVEASGPELVAANIEWAGRTTRHTGIGLRISDGSGGLKGHVAIGRVGSVYASAGSPAWFWPFIRRHERAGKIKDNDIFTVSVHGGRIWWNVWLDPLSSTRGTPRWRHGNFAVADRVLGQRKVTRDDKSPTVSTILPLPEGNYTVDLKVRTVTIRRRFGRPRTHSAYHMSKVTSDPGYIPSPGNIDSDFYDGPDGTFSMSGGMDGPATIPNAVGHIVAHVLAERARRGVAPDYNKRIGG